MSLPEGYLPRKGDELLIRVRAKSDVPNGEDGFFEIVGKEYEYFFLSLDQVHSLYCRKWNVDDRVNLCGYIIPLEVIGVCEDKVWLRYPNGSMATYEANELEPYVEPATDMVALGEEVALSYPDAPPPSSQALIGDDEEIVR